MNKPAGMHIPDTELSNVLTDYENVLDCLGFEKVLADPWNSSHNSYKETLFIYATRDGMLLKFDTYAGARVNGGNVYYNLKGRTSGLTSSGGMARNGADVWCGDHDCREHLIRNVAALRSHLVCPWAARPFLWLLNYDEPKVKDYDFRAITNERIGRLPQWVQDFIGPESP